jgi:hypothetical protein
MQMLVNVEVVVCSKVHEGYPLTSPISNDAARIAKNETSVLQVAEEVGVDVNRLKTDLESPLTNKVIRANYTLAKSLSINGTPWLSHFG